MEKESNHVVADPGEGPPLVLDQTEARRAEKKLFGDCPRPTPLF